MLELLHTDIMQKAQFSIINMWYCVNLNGDSSSTKTELQILIFLVVDVFSRVPLVVSWQKLGV